MFVCKKRKRGNFIVMSRLLMNLAEPKHFAASGRLNCSEIFCDAQIMTITSGNDAVPLRYEQARLLTAAP